MPVQIDMAKPADLAGEYLRGVQTAGQIKEAQDRLSAQAAEAGARAQAAAQQHAQEAQVEQQRIRVSQQYQQQQIGLRKQQLQQAAAVNAEKTATAARQFDLTQKWNAGLGAIDADASLSQEQKDAAKTQFIMRNGPAVRVPEGAMTSMLSNLKPAKPTAPSTTEDIGGMMRITNPNTGAVTYHNKPAGAKPGADNVKVIVSDMDGAPPVTMTRAQAERVIPSLPPTLRTNAVNQSVMAPSGSPKKSRFKYDPAKDALTPFE